MASRPAPWDEDDVFVYGRVLAMGEDRRSKLPTGRVYRLIETHRRRMIAAADAGGALAYSRLVGLLSVRLVALAMAMSRRARADTEATRGLAVEVLGFLGAQCRRARSARASARIIRRCRDAARIAAGLAAVARRITPAPTFTPLERMSVAAVALHAP